MDSKPRNKVRYLDIKLSNCKISKIKTEEESNKLQFRLYDLATSDRTWSNKINSTNNPNAQTNAELKSEH
jgi:type VI protein secretion system component Hcp